MHYVVLLLCKNAVCGKFDVGYVIDPYLNNQTERIFRIELYFLVNIVNSGQNFCWIPTI